MLGLYILTAASIVISLLVDKKKTFKGIKKGMKMMSKILPQFTFVIILISLGLYFTTEEQLVGLLGKESNPITFIIALLAGSLGFMPGFIAFPLAKILLGYGVPYITISAFTSSLMMVGIVTMPIEKEYFGFRFALIRNVISLFIAIIVAIAIGFAYAEI